MTTAKRQKTLDEVTPLLGHAYTEWKEWETRKNSYKGDFFELADEAIELRGHALKLVAFPGSEEVAIERVKRHYPAWRIDTHRPHRVTENLWEFVLSEDPALMPFSYEHEGIKYARMISKGAVMVDDEWLKDEDPELYEAVTYELPWGDRITVPIDHLEKEALGQLTKYLYNARPQVKLSPPRAVNKESE